MYRRKRFYRKKRFFGRRKVGLKKFIKRTVMRMAETKIHIQNINFGISGIAAMEEKWADVIDQGTGSEQRIGNQITVKNISFDLSVQFQPKSTQETVGWFRIMVLWPRKGLSTTDLVQYLTVGNPGVFGRADPDQMITLYDKRAYISGIAAGNGITSRRFKFSKFCRWAKWNYEDATQTVDCQPILYCTTDLSGATSSEMLVRGTLSISYKDM